MEEARKAVIDVAIGEKNMRLVQWVSEDGARRVGRVTEDGDSLERIDGVDRVYHLAREAERTGRTLGEVVSARASGQLEDYQRVIDGRRLLPPLDHPDPAHWLVTGTGLSHLGSAAARDAMHARLQQEEQALTDSMRMFKWGVEGGRPKGGQVGTPPEWFYKGDGRWVVAPEQSLELPAFARDGGEEVEVCGLYVVGLDGTPLRVGFALANEYSDHVIERQNYLYLAHSKLRNSSYGPELLVGDLPSNLRGTVRLLRDGRAIWSSEWLSGEENMCHSVANLEHHHFKYRQFRTPGDVHVHYFGAATGSFTQKVETVVGDVFEIAAPGFGKPLRNTLGPAIEDPGLVSARALWCAD